MVNWRMVTVIDRASSHKTIFHQPTIIKVRIWSTLCECTCPFHLYWTEAAILFSSRSFRKGAFYEIPAYIEHRSASIYLFSMPVVKKNVFWRIAKRGDFEKNLFIWDSNRTIHGQLSTSLKFTLQNALRFKNILSSSFEQKYSHFAWKLSLILKIFDILFDWMYLLTFNKGALDFQVKSCCNHMISRLLILNLNISQLFFFSCFVQQNIQLRRFKRILSTHTHSSYIISQYRTFFIQNIVFLKRNMKMKQFFRKYLVLRIRLSDKI